MSNVADPNENEVPTTPQKKHGWGWPSPLEVLVMIAIVTSPTKVYSAVTCLTLWIYVI